MGRGVRIRLRNTGVTQILFDFSAHFSLIYCGSITKLWTLFFHNANSLGGYQGLWAKTFSVKVQGFKTFLGDF